MVELLILTQLISCAFLTGLIWIVQLVHYPSFHFVDKVKFFEFNRFHQASISVIVLPAMLIELSCAIALFWLFPSSAAHISSLVLVTIIWLSTFFLSVPCHGKLLRQRSSQTIKRLVNTNWIRTISWSLRLVLTGYLLSDLINFNF